MPRHPYPVQAIAIKETTTIKAEMEDIKATATRVRRQYDEAEEAHTKHLDKLRVGRGDGADRRCDKMLWLEAWHEGRNSGGLGFCVCAQEQAAVMKVC